jgi:hypothetical protein
VLFRGFQEGFRVKVSGFRSHGRTVAAAFGGRFWEHGHGSFMVINVLFQGFSLFLENDA